MFAQYIENEKKSILERLFECLRIASISADSQYRDTCLKQANWLIELFERWGYQAELWQADVADGLPTVFAQNEQIDGRPTILFYGHYDVQPVDPITLWDSDPFEPIIKDNYIFARGANDDKGQLFTFLEALHAFDIVGNSLNLNIKIFLEGEEESGSPSLKGILDSHKNQLACDVVLVSDVDMWSPTQPAFTTMLKGKAAFEVTLTGPIRDLHSGLYGGPVSNPAVILSRIIGKMFDDNNHVLIPGFYDDIKEIDANIKQNWAPLNEHLLKNMADVGMTVPGGEKGYTALEQNWCRPTLEINGLTSGYQGEGGKTIIPSKASAKISCRLVEGQDPNKILKSFHEFFHKHCPTDIKVNFEGEAGARAFVVDHNDPFVQKAKNALDDIFKDECLLIGCGASIPAAIDLKEITNAPIILGGWGQPSDAIHAPNENYSLGRFFKGIEGWGAILQAFEKKEIL
ncbi:MAG: M20/M25/M40 family metallo-hydrolase [Alphaproteobacteria bacterium]